MNIAYIGLGTMGLGMARRLVEYGPPAAVFDVRPEPVAELAALGARAASDVADVAHGADVAFVNVVNDAQVNEVVVGRGSAGLLAVMSPGSVIVVQSTVHPDTCRTLARSAAERGVGLVDAPFTGGAAAAAAGRLALFVGGATEHVELVTPLLEHLGDVHHLGGVGAGLTAKLANNLVIANTLVAVHEALALAAVEGIDERVMLGLLGAGAADNWVVRNWDGIAAMAQTYPGGTDGLSELTYKDVTLALAVAHEHAVPLPATALAGQSLADAYRRVAKSVPARPRESS